MGFVEVRRRQLGAFTRAQANAYGVSDRSLAAQWRAGRIQRLYHGVYVDFSGPVPWETRLWGAWLAYGPDAALAGETAELDRLRQLLRRGLLAQVLRDAVGGVESFLELTYLRKVERAHGLPTGARQVRVSDDHGTVYRDVEYEDYGLAVASKPTLRFGYQLVGDPCTAAAQVATVLRALGWPDLPTPCGPTCSLPPILGSAAHAN